MDKIKKQDDAVMKALDISIIRRLICITNKGQLDLVIRKGENNYFLSIDSVPLEKEINDKLMDILFKVEIPQVGKCYEIKRISEKEAEIKNDAIDKIVNPINNIVVGLPTKKGKITKVK